MKTIISFIFAITVLFPSISIAQTRTYGRNIELYSYPYKELFFVSPRFDRQNQKYGNYYDTYLLRTVLTLDQTYHFRVDLPFASSNASGENQFGFADMNIKFMHTIPTHKMNNRLYGAYGFEMVLPTASHENLGSGKWQLWPGLGLIYFKGEGENTTGTYSLSFEYRFSFAGDKDRPDIKILAWAPNVDWWFKKWYVGYYATWTYDLENEILDIPVDIEVGYNIVSSLVLSVEFIQPLLKNRSYNNEFGIKLRYNFPVKD